MTHAPIFAATLDGLIDLCAPDPRRITLRAIAHSLSRINRWTGATESPINVAQHSIIVFEIFVRLFPEHRARAIYALLHDGHEYVTGDITRPMQATMARRFAALDAEIERLKSLWDAAIRDAEEFRLPHPDPIRDARLLAAVHAADLLAADLEWKLWMPAINGPSPFHTTAKGFRSHGYRVREAMSPGKAEAAFLDLAADLLEARPWEREAA